MLYVSIGRNVGEVPMPLDVWEDFRARVIEAIYAETFVDPDTKAYGLSRYGSMREETAVFVWFDVMAKPSDVTVGRLRDIAEKFGQECIAWSVSVTNFVEGVA